MLVARVKMIEWLLKIIGLIVVAGFIYAAGAESEKRKHEQCE